MKTRTTVIAALALAGFCASASASETFLEIGQSQYQTPPNGIWWQDQYPHEFYLESGYYRLGLGFGKNAATRISYFSLGGYSTTALATDNEEAYFSGECRPGTCQDPNYYVTSGSVRGLALSHVLRWGPLYLEPGVTYMDQKFNLDAKFVQSRSTDGLLDSDTFSFSGRRQSVGYMLGVGYALDAYTVSFSYFKSNASAQFGAYPGIDTVTTVSIGYSIK